MCVDVEAYERDHGKVTEVGIATLDTRDLMQVTPGKDGEAWRPLIKARHFRVQEYSHLVNHEFVQGCPGSFFFGESEMVSLKDLPALVAECFMPPFSARPNGELENEHNGPRNLIFLGHDTLTDVKYLQNIGFDPLSLPNLVESQDTASLYRVWQRQEQITRLGKMLERFDIRGHGLHNAGNDAVYTLQSFLAICVCEASIRNTPEVQKIWDDWKQSNIAFEQQELGINIEKDAKVWENLESDGDGGDPVPLLVKTPTPPKAEQPASASVDGGNRNEPGDSNGASASINVEHGDQIASNGAHAQGAVEGRPGNRDNSDGWGGTAAW